MAMEHQEGIVIIIMCGRNRRRISSVQTIEEEWVKKKEDTWESGEWFFYLEWAVLWRQKDHEEVHTTAMHISSLSTFLGGRKEARRLVVRSGRNNVKDALESRHHQNCECEECF